MTVEVVSADRIIGLFATLQSGNIRYLLLRDVGCCLPDRLPRDQDVDLLVHPDDAGAAHRVLRDANWRQVRHPWDFGSNFVFLYSMIPFRMYQRDSVHADIAFQLACRSTNRGEWMPLDQQIQDLAWSCRVVDEKSPWKYRLSPEDELVHLLTRCIFDKKQFPEPYRERITELFAVADRDGVRHRLDLVFFRFRPTLEHLIADGAFDDLPAQYIRFADY